MKTVLFIVGMFLEMALYFFIEVLLPVPFKTTRRIIRYILYKPENRKRHDTE